jgi:hypothetical protein
MPSACLPAAAILLSGPSAIPQLFLAPAGAAAGQAASGNAVSVMSAQTAGQVISVLTVRAADRPSAVAVALAAVSEALRRPAASSSR